MRCISSLILVVIVVLSSCKRDEPNARLTPMLASDFPSTVGSEWVYKRTDSFTNVVDTFRVKIIADVSSTTKMWQLAYSNATDTTYYMIVGDTALQCITNFNFYTQKLKFPYDVGTTYSNGGIYSTVIDRSDIMTNNILLSKAFHTYYSIYTVESDFKQESWVEKRVGIVKQHTTANSWDTGVYTNYTIELLSTNIH